VSARDTDVLIAGGGLAGQRCCETLRRLGFDGRIVLLCAEPRLPYDRPPLSKAALSDPSEPAASAYRAPDWYAAHAVEPLLGVAASGLDAARRSVALAEHGRLRYGSLVIATGSRPRQLAGLEPGGALHELRTYEDALALRAALRRGGRLAVLGAGLVGMEVAASARALGLEVVMVEAAPTPLARALPPALGAWIADLHRAHGVDVRLGVSVSGVQRRRDGARLRLSDGAALDAQTVLVAAGTVPATQWLADSGLGPGSIATDEAGRTALPGVYAAGDVAAVPDPFLGRAVATQHWEAAARQGAAVARAIAGRAPPAPAPAMFWSDQHGRRLQLVGHAPSEGATLAFEGDPMAGGPFAAWIARAGVPVGALLVDRPDTLPRARRAIAAATAVSLQTAARAA
jgi:NADPH-dependent 2,4-dienoyl-CoA reductase/sulfur reductase-like enzyme